MTILTALESSSLRFASKGKRTAARNCRPRIPSRTIAARSTARGCLARQWIDAALDRWIDAALDRWIDAALDRWIISKDFFTSRPDAAALDAAVDAAIFALDLDAAAFDGRMNAALDRWIESDHDRYFAKFLDGRPAAAILATALDAALDRHKQAKESGPA